MHQLQPIKSKNHKLKDIISGQSERLKKHKNKTKFKQVGYTLGNYKEITKDIMNHMPYKITDKGYLMLFESKNEVKFMTTNKIFQKIL